MKIALINDQHFGIKSDAPYMLDYQEKFYKNVFFPHLIKNGVETILIGGDLFDRRKYINYMSLNRTKEMFFDVALDLNIDVIIIPGNHDCYFKSTNDVNSIELLLAKEYSNVRYIGEPTTLSFLDDCTIDMIPWINGENYEATMEFIKNSKSEIAYAHLEIAGFEMYAGMMSKGGMSPTIFKDYVQVWTGHYHHKSSRGNIHYLGSPMEFTFADSNDRRGFHTYNTTNKELTYIQNPYTMYEKIYYNDESVDSQKKYRNLDTSAFANKTIKLFVVRKTKPAIFEYFVDKLYNEEGIDLVIHEDYSAFAEENIDVDVIEKQSTKDLMDTYVDVVETDMNKDKLKNILNDVYVEALNIGKAGSI